MKNKILINGPLNQIVIAQLFEKMRNRPDSGGHSVFFGQVREDKIYGKQVKAIEYSAYESMVEVEADKIIKSVSSQFMDVKSIDILHSTGIVRAGELSLFVLVSAGHRTQAMEACSKTVELIKEKLPVWKKEIFEDESHQWK